MARQPVTMYTDGACIGNPGPGGFGVVLLTDEKREELSAGYRLTTNNRMEIQAVIAGLQSLQQDSDVTIYSDSQYVVNSMTKGWAVGWRKKGWRRNKGEVVPNFDLWQILLSLVEQHHVTFEWVRGHSGNPENERCDYLSVRAAKKPTIIDVDYETPPLLPDDVEALTQTVLTEAEIPVKEEMSPRKETAMNIALVRQVAKEAKRDGFTLQWSLMHLIELLERNQSRLNYQNSGRDGDENLSLRIDNQAMALLILAAIEAFPAGKDVEL